MVVGMDVSAAIHNESAEMRLRGWKIWVMWWWNVSPTSGPNQLVVRIEDWRIMRHVRRSGESREIVKLHHVSSDAKHLLAVDKH